MQRAKRCGKRIEAALHFRQTLSEKLPSASRSRCIFSMFVIGHVFLCENVDCILSRSSQLVFVSCILVICLFCLSFPVSSFL